MRYLKTLEFEKLILKALKVQTVTRGVRIFESNNTSVNSSDLESQIYLIFFECAWLCKKKKDVCAL